MNQFFSVFSELYPLQDDKKVQLRQNVLISMFVTLFLFLFKPFGLNQLEAGLEYLSLVYLGYGVVTFLITLICDRVIMVAFPRFFNEQHWTVAKNIIWVLFTVMLIGIGNLFYSNLLGFTGISGTSFLQFQAYTVLVAIFPITVMVLLNRNRLLYKNMKEVKSINSMLAIPDGTDTSNISLFFSSDNGKDVLKLNCEQFLFAEAADNYTDVVYIENSITRKALIRSSLKRLEEFNQYPCILRTHRSYLVNLKKVTQVIGNSQGYRMAFEGLDETVPVARRNAQQVRQQLSLLHHSNSGGENQ